MKRLAALLLAWSLSVWSALCSSEERTIVLLGVSPQVFSQFAEAEERLRAELSAAGFRTLRRTSSATSDAELLAELRTISAFAAVVVLRESAGGVAYVTFAAQAEREPPLSVRSESWRAEPLALSVVEVIRARAVDIELVPVAKREDGVRASPPREQPPVRPVTQAFPPPRRWQLLAEFGPSASPAMNAWGWSLAASVGLALGQHAKVEVGGRWMVIDATSGTRAGEVQTHAWDARAYALGTLVRSNHLEWDLGLGIGGFSAAVRGRALPPFEARRDAASAGVVSIRSRLAWWVQSGVGFVVVVEPGLLVPPLEVAVDAHELAVLGAPWFNAGTGVILAL